MATALFLGLIGYQIVAIKSLEGGRFVYPIDDGYAHMAIAKNVVQHGIWTFNAVNGFESASSSMLWPLLLAVCFAVFGVHEYIPLVLNIVGSVVLLFYLGELLRRSTRSVVLNFLALVVIVIFTPLCAVVATGMEHSVQFLLTVAFVDMAARLLMDGSEQVTTRNTPVWFCLAGVLMVSTRYEGLFLIAAAGLLLLCRRRWTLAIVLGVTSLTPLVLFGLYSLHKGWYFLPNSLILKGNTTPLVLSVAGLILYFSKGYNMMTSEPHMPALVLAAVVALLGSLQRRWNLWTYPALVLLITLITAAQHFQFASLGWFYRYEDYLIILIFFGVGIALGQDGPAMPWRYWLRPSGVVHMVVFALAAFLFGTPQWPRTSNSYPHVISGSYSVYRQQYQMGRFVRRFYRGAGVIANDVGAISYMGEGIDLLDYAGLSDAEVLRLRRQGLFTQEAMRRLSQKHHSQVAIVYDNWITSIIGGPLPEWVKLGTWITPNDTVGGDTVAFYATSQAQVPKLLSALQQFSADLPKDMVQDGPYRGAESLSPVDVYYPPGGVKEALHFWTQHQAQFSVYPAEGQVFGSDDTTLSLALFTINENQTIDIFFNDEPVLTKAISPAESGRWISFLIKAKWRPGANTIRLVGHGDACSEARWRSPDRVVCRVGPAPSTHGRRRGASTTRRGPSEGVTPQGLTWLNGDRYSNSGF